MREAVMHRTNIGKAAACVYDGKLCARVSTEEEQPGVFLCRICCLFLVRVDVIENRLPGIGMAFQVITDLNRLIRIDIAVPGKRKKDVYSPRNAENKRP